VSDSTLASLAIERHAEGSILPVRAQPKARRNGLNGVHDGALRVQVTAAPEQGKANKAIVKLLADLLGISASRCRLLSGETSSRKKFLIEGVTVEELLNQLGKQEGGKD
jgi:hypothetical protein